MRRRVPGRTTTGSVVGCMAAVLALAAGEARGQAPAWPTKPIRIIVPYAPGGPFDEVARILSQRLHESWGQPVLVENRSGAGGSIAAEFVARSAPDGYTLLHGNAGPLTINPSLMRKVGYDPVRDFAPVSLLLTSAMVLVVHPSLPVRSVADLVRLARAHPGELNYASAGVGNLQHLGMESLQARAGIRMNHVPYKGAAPAFVDIFGGRIGLMFANVVGAMPHIKAGKLRAVAVSSARRSASLPEVPAVAETYPGFDMPAWMGILAAAATPRDIVARLSAEFARIMQHPEVRPRLIAQGADPVGGSPADLAAVIARELELYGSIIRQSGIRPE
jgi:tripartite-type tricarboxylate transporter receptor subunit TctC